MTTCWCRWRTPTGRWKSCTSWRCTNWPGRRPREHAPELRLRTEQPEDRPAILALTAAAFAISPVTGLPVDGEPEEVGLLRRLFDCAEYLPEFSIVAELDGEIVGHVISTRGWVGELELLGLGPDRRGAAAAAPRHRHGADERDRGRAPMRRGSGGSPCSAARSTTPASASCRRPRSGVAPPEAGGATTSSCSRSPYGPEASSGTFRYAGPFAG